MKQLIQLRVNGEDYEVFVAPHKFLSEVLREELNLTGVKVGCQTGECGACTVLIAGEAVRSCLILAVQVRNREITTIEGLAKGEKLHPVQQAFIDHFAIQCGYCTPAMVFSARVRRDRNQNLPQKEVK